MVKYGRVKYHIDIKLNGKPVFRHLEELQRKASGDFTLKVGKYEITAVMGSWGKSNPWPKINIKKANGSHVYTLSQLCPCACMTFVAAYIGVQTVRIMTSTRCIHVYTRVLAHVCQSAPPPRITRL